MRDEPDIVKQLREEEKQGKLYDQSLKSNYEELEMVDEPLENISNGMANVAKNDIGRTMKNGGLGDIEEKYRTIFENSAVAITLANEKERIVSWNKYTEELLGMSKEELSMKPVESLYPPEEWQKIRSENVRQKGMQHHLETKILRKNDEPLDVDISLSVLKDRDGKVIGSIGVIKDITKSKQMEKALRESEEKFKQLYKRAPIPYHTLSPNGKITDINEKWCNVFGYNKEEVIGKSIFDFIIENERDTARSSFKEKILSKKLYTGGHERAYVTKDGEKQIFVINDFFSFDENNNVKSIHTTMEDITERKRIELELQKTHDELERRVKERTAELTKINELLKQEINERKHAEKEIQKKNKQLETERENLKMMNLELNVAREQLLTLNKELEQRVKKRTHEVEKLLKQKDEFIHQLGHDLKNPLTPIANLLPIVIEKPDDPKTRRRLEIIYRNVNYIKNLVTDTLKLARFNSQSIKLDIHDINLLDLANNVINDNQLLFEENGIKVENMIDKKLYVKVDGLHIKEVFNNLFSNAIKSMEQGGTLTFDAGVSKDKKSVTISIKDTGFGMTNEQVEHIFDEFYKADESRHDLDSSGLGLSICKRIIERHGGQIWAENHGLRKGTTFYFTIPSGSKIKNG